MKKIIMVILIMLVVLCTGCGNKITDVKTDATEAITDVGTTDKEELITMTPDSSSVFNGEVQICNNFKEDCYGFFMNGADQTVYNNYVQLCKDTYYSVEVYNINSGAFKATTSDEKYTINVSYVESGNYVLVKVTQNK